jgi:hypothetical protein
MRQLKHQGRFALYEIFGPAWPTPPPPLPTATTLQNPIIGAIAKMQNWETYKAPRNGSYLAQSSLFSFPQRSICTVGIGTVSGAG